MSNHAEIKNTLAKLLNKQLPDVVKVNDDTFIINGVVSKKLKHGWLLKNQFYPSGLTVTHPKAGVILPWILNERGAQNLCDRILELDRLYGFSVFEMDNQRRLISKYQQLQENDRLLVHLTKFKLAKDRARALNSEILTYLTRVKFAK